MPRPGPVLVVHPPMSVARDFIDYPYMADLGAVQLAAVLGSQGFDTALVNAFALEGAGLSWREDGRAHLGATVAHVLAQAARAGEREAVVVALTPFHRPPHRDDVLAEVLAGLKRQLPDAWLLLADCYQSGQHYIEAPAEAVLAAYPEVDSWVQYEAEVTVPALLAANERPAGVVAGEAPNLDALPFPAWGEVDLTARDAFCASVVRHLGRGTWAFPIDGRTLPLVTSRGCPFSCLHCSSNPGLAKGEPKTQRRTGLERLREHLEVLVAQHGASRLAILDELANVNEAHFDGLLDILGDLDVAFDIPNGLRADYLEARHLRAMRGRVTTVSVSAESGAQGVVQSIVNKRLDLGTIVRAAEQAHGAGVPLMVHYIIGLPGESAAQINETLEMALDLWDRFGAWPAVQFATPLPGTALGKAHDGSEVHDFGPHFQKTPLPLRDAVEPALLERFRRTFEQRLQASMGPEKLIVNVTYVCNNHCTFCAVGTRTQIDAHPTRLREHLDKYRRHGIDMVDFDGGEPTLNPELIPLVRHAKRIGFKRVHVTTNGRMCAYEEYAAKLVNSGIDTLLFSVHGPNATIHAQQVGVAEAFEQTKLGIEHCLRLAPEGLRLGMNITVTKGNHALLEEMAQLCWDVGLRWMNIQFLTPFGRATSWVAPDTHEAARFAMEVIDRWRDRLELQVINLPFCFMPGYEDVMTGDLQKLSRHMVFVNNDTVNLADYLAERRVRRPECEPCPHRCFCGGFYELDNVPEPEWLVTEESLLRPTDPSLVKAARVPTGTRGR